MIPKSIKKEVSNDQQHEHAKHQVKIGSIHCSFCASSTIRWFTRNLTNSQMMPTSSLEVLHLKMTR